MQLAYKLVKWKLHFFWNNCSNAHHYRIMAMSHTFVYYMIGITSDLYYDFPLNDVDSYIRFKVVAESINNVVLEESNEINILSSDFERFEITALNWYNGTTLVFRSKWVYDLYKVYNDNELIAETQDPILQLSYKITKNKLNNINVEWYTKVDNEYYLWWVSCETVKISERKKSDYKISVVIPVYNAQTFLSRTVDSILSSSMSDIEIILVDDGSTDNSLNICKWYAKNFPCVSVVQQKNQWVSVARNTWVDMARWEYLGFVDSDDIVHPFMYENLYNTCKAKNVELSLATTIIHNDINKREVVLDMSWNKENIVVYTYDEMMQNIGKKDNMYFVAVWNKIVKTKVVKQLRFPTDYPNTVILYEDSAYTPMLYSYIDKFALCKDAYYIWDKRQRNTIGTLSTRYKNSDDIWKSFIYAYSYPIYNRCNRHKKLCDYACFKRLIESYDKFEAPSLMLDYWNEKLRELINKQELYKNELIMGDDHLKNVISKLCGA